jgi:hypothetical protein
MRRAAALPTGLQAERKHQVAAPALPLPANGNKPASIRIDTHPTESSQAKGLLRNWMATAAQRAIAIRSENQVINFNVAA